MSSTARGTARATRIRLLAALVPVVYLCALVAWVGLDDLTARLINDDPSYYILVAKNLFVRGPTYDGLYLTNGVHPLFAVALGAIYRVSSSQFAELAAISVATCVSFGAGVVYVLLGARPVSAGVRAAVVVVLGSVAVYPVLYRGMEGALALLMVTLYLDAVARGSRNLCVLGALSIGLWAARLELIALPPIALLIGTGALPPRQRSRLLAAWLISLSAFGLYAAASEHFIGIALPVSGLIKQSTAAILPNFISLGAACAALSAAPLLLPGLRPLARRAFRTRALLAFAAVFYLSHGWGQPDIERQTWYYFPLPGLLAFALVELGDEVGPALRRFVLGVVFAAALATTVWEARYVIPLRGQAWAAMQSVAQRAKERAAPGERFMGPGWMSLLVGPEFEAFSQDGLVGGVEQYRALRAGRALDFAYESGVRYLFVSGVTPGLAPPALPDPYRLERISEGLIPNGRSLWAAISTPDDPCALRPCTANLGVYRLHRDDEPARGLAARATP